jgi:hypothetical protein
MAKMFRPNKTNLMEAIYQKGEFKDYRKRTPIETKIAEHEEDILIRIRDIESGGEPILKIWGITLSLGRVQSNYLDRIPAALWHGDMEHVPQWFRTAFAYFDLQHKVMHALDLEEGFSYEKRFGPLDGFWYWRGWSILGGATELSDQVGVYLYNALCTTDETKMWNGLFPIFDWPTRNFIRYIEKANLTGQWPKEAEIASMGWYADIVRHAGTSQFAQVLEEFCDTRIAQMFRFDSLTAEKRNKYELMDNIRYCDNPSDFVPLELHVLSHVHQRCRGSALDLSIPHALLDSPIARFAYPKLLPMEDDDTLRMVRGYAQKYLAPHWNPDLKYEVVYPL